MRLFKCQSCGFEFEAAFGSGSCQELSCPKCREQLAYRINPGPNRSSQGKNQGRQRRLRCQNETGGFSKRSQARRSR